MKTNRTFGRSTSSRGFSTTQNAVGDVIFKDNNDNEVGRLIFENGKILFEGDVDASAQQFFETVIKDKVKSYIKSQ